MIWWLPVAGAAAGALMNRKNPLQGAAMGGLLGAGAGFAAPAMMGGAAAAGSAGAASGAASGGLLGSAGAGSQAAMLAAQEAGLGSTALGWGGATTGLQGGLNSALGSNAGAAVGRGLAGVEAASQYAKPVGDSLNAAKLANGLLAPEKAPIQHQMQPQMVQGEQMLSTLANQDAQQLAGMSNADMERRKMRRQLIGSIA